MRRECVMRLLPLVCCAGFVTVAPVRAQLRHHWPLDEKSGMAAADVAAGATGSLDGFGNGEDSHWVDGQISGALDLGAGTTLRNNVTVELPALSAAVSGGFTIMMWMRPGDIVGRAGEYQLFMSPGDVVGFTIYSLVVNVIVGPGVGGWFFPTPDWFILILWVVPPFIAVALSIIVAISARVKTAAAAQQASQLVTLPVILSAYGVATGLLFNSSVAAVVIGAVAWVAALIGLTRGARSVKRENLIS